VETVVAVIVEHAVVVSLVKCIEYSTVDTGGGTRQPGTGYGVEVSLSNRLVYTSHVSSGLSC
jgi:hypothetical protein